MNQYHKAFIILLFLMLPLFSLTVNSQNNVYRTYQVKYILDNDGYAIKYENTFRVAPHRMYILRNGQEDYWVSEYKGTIYEDPGKGKGKKIGLHTFYLTNKKVTVIISDYKLVKHDGVFYYLINFGGDRLLAL